MTTLAELDTLTNDVEVAAPEEYVASSLPDLLPESTYNFLITEWDVSRNRDTKEPDGKAVILNVIVADGDYAERQVRNLRVWTATYERRGVKVSGLGDLIRALDRTAHFRTIGEACAIIQKAQDTRTPFRAKIQWEAFDNDWFIAQGGQNLMSKSPEAKALRKAATIKGMRNFRQAPDGSYLPMVEGPSGNELEARISLDRYF